MNDKHGRQVITAGDPGFTRPASPQFPALIKKARPCSPVDCTVNTAPAKECRICGIDDGIHVLGYKVAHNDGDPVTDGKGHVEKITMLV